MPIPDDGFTQWVEFCFDRRVGDEPGDDDSHLADVAPSVLATYLARLFENSGTLVGRFSPDQIGQGLWFICGVQSSYFHTARESSVPVADQVRWVRSIRTLYSEVFSRVCAKSLGHLGESGNRANAVCYMLWDLDCLEGAAMFPGHEHLVDPIFEVLEYALAQPHPACTESSLHGLGHLYNHHPDRVAGLIDHFLGRGSARPELVKYAEAARSGTVL